MQALKLLVIFMAILIFLGLGLLAYGVVERGGRLAGGSDDDGGPQARPGGPVAFGEIALPLPAGCTLGAATGAEGRLLVRLAGPLEQGCQQILVYDLATGARLGRILGAPAR